MLRRPACLTNDRWWWCRRTNLITLREMPRRHPSRRTGAAVTLLSVTILNCAFVTYAVCCAKFRHGCGLKDQPPTQPSRANRMRPDQHRSAESVRSLPPPEVKKEILNDTSA